MVRRLLFGSGPVRVQPFFGYRSASRLILSARALQGPEARFDAGGFWRSLRTMLGQYASHEVPGTEITLEFETGGGEMLRQSRITGPEGFAKFELSFDQGYDLPLKTGWENASISWHCKHTGEARSVTGYILAPGRSAGIGIISDIDDTILETGITGSVRAIARNWKRVLAQMPSEREIVRGAQEFYGALGGEPGEHTHDPALSTPIARTRPIFYVSSSPWNLFSYLVNFKTQREMPVGPIMLRDWGFDRKTLGKKGHGSHKREAIEGILDAYPDLRFALVGDDTQKDLVAFGAVAAAHPSRIAAIFIRKISEEPLSDAEKAAREAIEKAGVAFWMGADYNKARQFLGQAGIDFDPAVDQLVRTASEGKQANSEPPSPSKDAGSADLAARDEGSE